MLADLPDWLQQGASTQSAPGNEGLLHMRFLKRIIVFGFVALINILQRFFVRHGAMYRLLFLPGLEGFRLHMSRERAWYIYEFARKCVQAYQADENQKNGPKYLLNAAGKIDISLAPEMDKESYVKKFSIEE